MALEESIVFEPSPSWQASATTHMVQQINSPLGMPRNKAGGLYLLGCIISLGMFGILVYYTNEYHVLLSSSWHFLYTTLSLCVVRLTFFQFSFEWFVLTVWRVMNWLKLYYSVVWGELMKFAWFLHSKTSKWISRLIGYFLP